MVSMGVADKDGLDISQDIPSVVWFVGIRAKESTDLAPCPLAGLKQDTPMVRDSNQVSRN